MKKNAMRNLLIITLGFCQMRAQTQSEKSVGGSRIYGSVSFDFGVANMTGYRASDFYASKLLLDRGRTIGTSVSIGGKRFGFTFMHFMDRFPINVSKTINKNQSISGLKIFNRDYIQNEGFLIGPYLSISSVKDKGLHFIFTPAIGFVSSKPPYMRIDYEMRSEFPESDYVNRLIYSFGGQFRYHFTKKTAIGAMMRIMFIKSDYLDKIESGFFTLSLIRHFSL